jgi:hypothetical protein
MTQSPYSIGIGFETNNGTQGTYNVRFYPNGTRDNTSDFTQATALLAPTVDIIEAASHGTVDIWELVNWYFVSAHWTFLYQFGDIAPTIYPQDNGNGSMELIDGQVLLDDLGFANFSAPISFPPTNNIFWNGELFGIYSDYLTNTLMPFVLDVYPEFSFVLPQIIPLNDTNRVQRVPTTIFTSYQCSELVWKGWGAALVSILVAVFSLWTAGYGIMLIIFAMLEQDVPSFLQG